MSDQPTKRCAKCKVEKPLDEFHLWAKGKHGRKPRCKACVHEYSTRPATFKLRPPAAHTEMRVCTICKEEKPVSAFYNAKYSGNPFGSCKACRVIRGRLWTRD